MRFGAQQDPVRRRGSHRVGLGTQRHFDGPFRAVQDQAGERAPGTGDDIVPAGGTQRAGNAAADAAEAHDRHGRARLGGVNK